MRASISTQLVVLLGYTCWLTHGVDAACRGRQSYVLSVQMSFTRQNLATVSEKARIPLIVAVTHSASFTLFRKGDYLTDEVAEIAGQNRRDRLVARLDSLKDSGSVSSYSVSEDIPIDDVTQLEVTAEDDASLVSIMAPLSPSPAWFVGLASHPLCVKDEFIPEEGGIVFKNYDSGLQQGESLAADVEPFPEGETNAVAQAGTLDDTIFARLSLEQGTLGVDWWKIFLGVLVAVAVAIVLIVFVLPRCRRRKPADIPLTAPDGVQW